MDHHGLTLSKRKEVLFIYRKQFRTAGVVFLIVSLLPILLYVLFDLNILGTLKSKVFSEMETATAMVIIPESGKTGSAFLVTGSKMLTARHVVDEIPEGGRVDIVFSKAIPEINTSAIVEWKAPSDIATSSTVPLDYFLTDVAVLRLSTPMEVEDISPFILGDSEGIVNLTPVVAIGYPTGDFSIKRGDINSDMINGKDLFKVDPSVNSGDSGGPLILEGDKTVIGMMVGGLANSEGENIAIKINTIYDLLDNASVTLE